MYRKIEKVGSYVWFFKSNPSQLQSLYLKASLEKTVLPPPDFVHS